MGVVQQLRQYVVQFLKTFSDDQDNTGSLKSNDVAGVVKKLATCFINEGIVDGVAGLDPLLGTYSAWQTFYKELFNRLCAATSEALAEEGQLTKLMSACRDMVAEEMFEPLDTTRLKADASKSAGSGGGSAAVSGDAAADADVKEEVLASQEAPPARTKSFLELLSFIDEEELKRQTANPVSQAQNKVHAAKMHSGAIMQLASLIQQCLFEFAFSPKCMDTYGSITFDELSADVACLISQLDKSITFVVRGGIHRRPNNTIPGSCTPELAAARQHSCCLLAGLCLPIYAYAIFVPPLLLRCLLRFSYRFYPWSSCCQPAFCLWL